MKNLDRLINIASWIMNFLLVFAVFGSMSEADFNTYFSSDTLYLASIYKDIFIDSTGLRGWSLNAAPNFFPDMLIYFVINFLIDDFRVAYIFFSFIQYFIVLILLNSLLINLIPKLEKKYILLLNLLFPIFLLVTLLSDYYIYTYYLFSHTFHTGVFINFLITLILVFKYLYTKKRYLILLVFLFSLLGAYNDRLFIVLFTVPIIITLLYNILFVKNKQFYTIAIIGIVSSGISLFLYKLTENNSVFQCIGLDQKFMNFGNIKISFQNFIKQHQLYIVEFRVQGLITIIAVINFFVLLYYIILGMKKTRLLKLEPIISLYFIFIFSSIFITLFAPIINGYYFGIATTRFNIFSFWLSVFNVVIFVKILVAKKIPSLVIYSIFIFYTIIIVAHFYEHKPIRKISNLAAYYPEEIAVIDNFCKLHNVQYGLAEYWTAKKTTMFSKHGLRVYTVSNEELKPWYHVMNRNWYHDYHRGKYNDPIFRFILTNRFDREKLRHGLCEPIDSLEFNGKTILYLIKDIKFNKEGIPYKVLN